MGHEEMRDLKKDRHIVLTSTEQSPLPVEQEKHKSSCVDSPGQFVSQAIPIAAPGRTGTLEKNNYRDDTTCLP